MKTQTASSLARLAFTALLLCAASLSAIDPTTGSAGAATVPHCTASSRISAKLTGLNGAATWFYFLIAFTNFGSASCSLSGVPRAQAVEGTSRTPVGPAAKHASPSGTSYRGTVVLRAHGGKAYVEYYVINETDWTRSQCTPATARGVVLRPFGAGSFYIPNSRLGATDVCTKLASTAIGAIASRTY
jgi:hypothetical protein